MFNSAEAILCHAVFFVLIQLSYLSFEALLAKPSMEMAAMASHHGTRENYCEVDS